MNLLPLHLSPLTEFQFTCLLGIYTKVVPVMYQRMKPQNHPFLCLKPCNPVALMAQLLSGFGSKLRSTGLKPMPVRMFVIEVVHMQCSKLFKGLESGMISMVGSCAL